MITGIYDEKSVVFVILSFSLFSVSGIAVSKGRAKENTSIVTGHPPVAAPFLDNTNPYAWDEVTVDSKFSDPDGDTQDTSSSGTHYQWLIEEPIGSGKYQDIPGANGRTYIPEDKDRGKKLIVKVVPRTDPAITELAAGNEVTSNSAQVNAAAPPPVPFASIIARGYTFAINEGFPSTGFNGAVFTLITGREPPSYYTWNADRNWVKANSDGSIELSGNGVNENVTITATPTNGRGKALQYTFKISSWFYNDFSNYLSWSSANSYCKGKKGIMPARESLSLGGAQRGMGSLFSEWGPLNGYSAGFLVGSGQNYWTSSKKGSSYYMFYALDGDIGFTRSSGTNYVLCEKLLN